MATEQLIPVVNEVGMMEEEGGEEVDLCLVCCSKVKSEKDEVNNNSQLLSSNLIVFYLLRRVLQVTGIELNKTLISCGNPVEWIKLCDKCTELTRQAEELHRKLRKIEIELSCVQQLIWDKAKLSIDFEDDRKLVEGTINLTRKSSQVWRRFRKHVANKCKSTKRNLAETSVNPFAEGDKLANYLITQKVSTAILPIEYSDDEDRGSILEQTNFEVTSSPSSPVKIKIEVTPELDLEQAQLSQNHLDHHQNYENVLIDNLLEELREVKVEFDDQVEEGTEEDANLEKMEVEESGGDKLLVHEELDDKGDEEDVDWNWEPDDDADDNDDSEEDQEEEDDDEVEVDEGVPAEENWSTFLQTAIIPIVKRPPQTQTTPKKLLQKIIRTEDGKIKCRHCDQIFSSASGLNSHEREKHSKTPGAFICDICGGTFNSRDYLRKHKQRSHRTNPDGTSAMKNRKAIRTPDGKYKCRHCDQCFMNTSTCLTHENEKHSKNPGGFICDICGKAFNSGSYLRCHKSKTHKLKADGTPSGKGRNHICDKCGKGFEASHKLNRHIQFVHEKVFSIKCSLCGVGKRTKKALQSHMLAIHPEEPSTKQLIEEEGLGMWRCRWRRCGAVFLKESGLKDHLERVHGGKDKEDVEKRPEYKATCGVCGKVCRSKAGMMMHKETHMNVGTRDHFCDKCGKGFRMESGVKYHKKRTSCGGGGGGGK